MKRAEHAEYQELKDKLKIFSKMYEIARIVDPLKKEVLTLDDGLKAGQTSSCFDTWQRDGICDNCISMRACNENETMIKIEYSPERVYMVTAVPIGLNGRKIVIELLKDATHSMFLDEGGHKNNLGMQLAIDSLNQMALKDSLTGLFNRRYISERLPVDMIQNSLNGRDLSILFADLDHFKMVNDIYGHQAGDQIMVRFAQCLGSCVRAKEDWIARYGGEEVLVCLPGSNLEQAGKIAERMRKELECAVVVHGGREIKATASFGVASTGVDKITDPQELIKAADSKMYEAKESGRNRVVI